MAATITQTATAGADAPMASNAIETKAHKVAEDFESFFISTLLETMSSGLDVDPVFGGGHGEAVYRSMLNDEYAHTFAHAGGIGIADSVYREIMRMQEVP